MKKSEIIAIVTQKVEEFIAEENLDLFDIELGTRGGTTVLTVKLTSEDGVDLDDCHKIHVLLSSFLDDLDPFEDQYMLEVASPGLDAPLKSDMALKNSVGKEVYVKTYVAVKDYPKSVVGILSHYDDQTIEIISDEKTYTFERKMISTIKLHFEF